MPGRVVLVAHSYGDMTISVSADGNPNVRSLVVVDGHRPLPGETAAEPTNRLPGSQFGAALIAGPITLPGGHRFFMARRAGARITTLPSPHVGMPTNPGPITRVIEAAAR